MAVVASILFLGLLMMKVVLAISTVLVFIGMPIAIVLSPVVSWIPRVLARAFAVCLAVPFVWAVCFAASGAMLNDGLFLKGSSGFFDALLEPLAAIALLWMMLLLPSRLAQMAMLGAGAVRGGFVSRAVSYAAGSQMRDSARQHMPSWAGGERGASDQRSRATDSRLGARLSAESVLAASKAAGAGGRRGGRRGGAAGAGVASGGASGGANGGASGGRRASRRVGLAAACAWCGRARARTRRRRWRAVRRRLRRAGVCSGRAGGRTTSTRRCSRRRCASSASRCRPSRPGRRSMRSRPRRRARCRAWSPITGRGRGSTSPTRRSASGRRSEREAIRTLAAASPEVRAQAFARRQRVDVGVRRERRPETSASWVRAPRHLRRSPARSPAGNGGNGDVGTQPQDQPPPDRGGGS